MVGLGFMTAPAHAQGYHFAFKFGGLVDGQLYNPSGVAVDSSGNVIVVDTENYRIQVFDSQGNFLRAFGSQGSGDGQFNTPSGVAVSASGNIVVADTNNARILVFDSQGNFLSMFGSQGSG